MLGHGVHLVNTWREPSFDVVRVKVLAVGVLRGTCRRRGKVYRLSNVEVEVYNLLKG